jgi:hypothetical protein
MYNIISNISDKLKNKKRITQNNAIMVVDEIQRFNRSWVVHHLHLDPKRRLHLANIVATLLATVVSTQHASQVTKLSVVDILIIYRLTNSNNINARNLLNITNDGKNIFSLWADTSPIRKHILGKLTNMMIYETREQYPKIDMVYVHTVCDTLIELNLSGSII